MAIVALRSAGHHNLNRFGVFNSRHQDVCAAYKNIHRNLTDTQVSTAIKPIYTKVHPDLFGQYPRAQHINESSLKQLRSHLDTLLEKKKPRNVTLQFYVRDDRGELQVVSVELFQNEIRSTLQSVLNSFKLPLTPLSKMLDQKQEGASDRPIKYYGNMEENWEYTEPKRNLKLYDWLVKNMWIAEQKLQSTAPIRQDIKRLKQLIKYEVGVTGISSDSATATIRFRGCLTGLLELYKEYPDVQHALAGRRLHFGNVTGVNLAGAVVLGTSEVRSQWLSFIQQLPEVDSMLCRIPDMQKAVSIGLRDIQVTHRKFGGSVVARGYGHDLRRLVTSLSDHRGRHGLPTHWPSSLNHLQLVVEPAWGPMTLSPTGQLLIPSSCPPPHLVSFISDKLDEAPKLLAEYHILKHQEKNLHRVCREVFSLDMLQKDDSVVPQQMISCLERLLYNSDRLIPLMTGARVWITKYYTVMLDGEICIPWNWDFTDEQNREFKSASNRYRSST